MAVRHALTRFPDCNFVWFLDQNSFIMNPQLTIEEHVMKPSKLEGLMIKDYPVVPPDSIIKTFSHLGGQDVDFVVTQDKEGMSTSSFVVRNGDWAKFFLETWFDPLYRSYNFQRAETHALVSLSARTASEVYLTGFHRNILSNGTLLSLRDSPWFRSGRSIRTAEVRRAQNIMRGTW